MASAPSTFGSVAQSSSGSTLVPHLVSRLQRASLCSISVGECVKLKKSQPCHISVPPKRSMKLKAKKLRQGQRTDDPDIEIVEWISRVIHDPMVEVDPVMISQKKSAETKFPQDVSTSVISTSLLPPTQRSKSATSIAMVAVAALVLMVVATTVQIWKLRKATDSEQLDADARSSFISSKGTEQMSTKRKAVKEIIKATSNVMAATVTPGERPKGQISNKRSEGKQWNNQTFNNARRKQTDKTVIAEQTQKQMHINEARSHAQGNVLPPTSLPARLSSSLILNLSKKGGENQNGHARTLVSERQVQGLIQDFTIVLADHTSSDAAASFPVPSDLDNSIQRTTRSPISSCGAPENSVIPAPSKSESLALEVGHKSLKQERASTNKTLQAALLSIAIGVSAAGALTGVEGGLQVVGFAATASFVTFELLWAQTRKKLWRELRSITDRGMLINFLKDRKIVHNS